MTDNTTLSDEMLITRLRRGDEEAEGLLYARYKQVIRSKARSYFLVGADKEDVIQEGMIGLYKAICDYEFDKQVSFKAFADLCITRQIITAIKSATRKKHVPLNTYISLNRPVHEGEGVGTLVDVLAGSHVSSPEELLIGRENCEAMARSIEQTLSHLEKAALELYLQGHSYHQIASSLGKSTKCVDNAIQRIKKKLAKQINFLPFKKKNRPGHAQPLNI